MTTMAQRDAGQAKEISGTLHCPQCQRATHPRRNSPLPPTDHYSASFGLQWNRYDKTQLDSYSGLSISSDRVREVCQWSKSSPNPPGG